MKWIKFILQALLIVGFAGFCILLGQKGYITKLSMLLNVLLMTIAMFFHIKTFCIKV